MGSSERRRLYLAVPALVLMVAVALGLRLGGTPSSPENAPPSAASPLPNKAGAAPSADGTAQEFHTGLEELPASLAGTQVPSGLQVDAAGNLVVTPALRDLLDYFLSTLGEEELATIVARLHAYFDSQLPAAAAEQAREILSGYLGWREYLGTLPEAGGSHPSRLDLEAVRTQQRQVRDACQAYLDQSTCSAFFARQQIRDDYTLDRLAVIRNDSLSAEEKAQRISSLTAPLPPAMQEGIAEVSRYQTLQSLTAEHRQEGGDDAQLRTIREQVVGPAAASRLAELDQQRADFERRVDQWLEQRESLLANDNLSPSDREAQITQLRASQFSDQEQVRVRARERLSAP